MILLLAGLLAIEVPLAEADVRVVVDRWLAAQNGRDQTGYEKLYAARFTGIRRSGPRTVRFDRAGWMKDRARMFGKPMTVGAADVKIRVGGSSALVSFTQTFAQGSYKDVGPKQLVVVRDAGALKIATEKMLGSELLSAPVPKDERFRYVVSGALLLSEAPDEAWATGALKVHDRDPAVVSRRVDDKLLPPELARWNGRRIRIYDVAGKPHESTVKGFRLLSRSIPHFSTLEEWRDMKQAAAAKQAWELGSKVLVADVDPVWPEAVWAQPASRPAPDVDVGIDLEPGFVARVRAELRRTEVWKTIQKSYRESPVAGVARWDDLANARTEVRRLSARRKGKDIALISVASSFYEGCADFGGDIAAIYELRGDKLILRSTPGRAAVRAVGAVDADGDGDSELLVEPWGANYGFDRGRLLLEGDNWDRLEQVEVPYLDCPC